MAYHSLRTQQFATKPPKVSDEKDIQISPPSGPLLPLLRSGLSFLVDALDNIRNDIYALCWDGNQRARERMCWIAMKTTHEFCRLTDTADKAASLRCSAFERGLVLSCRCQSTMTLCGKGCTFAVAGLLVDFVMSSGGHVLQKEALA